MGAVSSAISFGIGEIATGIANVAAKALFQAAAHGVSGGLMNVLNGGDFLSGFASGAVSSLLSSGFEELSGSLKMSEGLTKVGMIAVGGLSGGLSSVIAGGNFWDGMRQGLITAGLNHVFHMGKDGKTKRVGDEGGDKIDYMVDDEGKVIASTPVEYKSDGLAFLGEEYGVRHQIASGAISTDPLTDLSLFSGGALGRVVGFVKSLFGAGSMFSPNHPTNIVPEGKLANHLFKGNGKLADNPANRALIQRISNGKSIGVDTYGKSWYTGMDGAGKSIYTYTQNGIVKGAGYATMTPGQMIIKYSLK